MKLWRARCRLYRSRFLQVNTSIRSTHLEDLAEICNTQLCTDLRPLSFNQKISKVDFLFFKMLLLGAPRRFFSQFEKRIFQFVLGCIDADFCDRIPCWKALHEIYKFHILRVTLISKFSHISVKIFSKKISTIVK